MAFQTSTNNYQNTKYIVGVGLPYTTIQAAINAAVAAGVPATIFVRSGTYTENLTLYSTIHLEGSESTDVIIIGQHTPPTSGSLSFTRIGFTATTTNSVLFSASAGTTDIKFSRCTFVVNNGYICNLTAWTGILTFRYCNEGASVNNGVINNATGTSIITCSNAILGTGTGNTMSVIGALNFFNVKLGCPLTIGGSAASFIEGGSILLGTLTTAGTANIKIRNSIISTGSVTAITIGSSVAMLLSNAVVDTTNAVAVAGTGTVNFNEATFPNSKAIAGTITEGLAGVVKTGEIYANTVLRMDMTGFYSWAAAGPYYDAATLGTFKLLVGGTGYIRGKVITWVAQDVTGMTSGACWYIYIDSTGTIGKTSTRTDALFVDYIVLFECLYDETTVTKQQHVVRENHPYNYQTSVSNYEHDVIGTVIENANNGANIVAGTTGVRVSISGADVLADHGLDTIIPAATDRTWKKMYKNAAGKWAVDTTGTDFVGKYNNAGIPMAIGSNKFAVYRLYVTKDDGNAATPTYCAVLHTAQFNNAGDAATAISNNTIAVADAELMALELCQLGFITFRESTGLITVFTIAKSTLRSTISGGVGSSTATGVTTNTASFDGMLSGSDTNVQAVLNTIDNWGAGTTDKCLMVGNGVGSAPGVLAVGGTGTILTGVAANDPTWTTATYPATVATGDILAATNTNVITVIAGTSATSGYVLTGNGSGVLPSWQVASICTSVGVNNQTASYALLAADAGKMVTMTVTSTANTVTVPKDATVNFAIGTYIVVYQGGTGVTTIIPEDGAITILSAGSLTALYARYSTACLIKIAANVWSLSGDLA